jgi:hypothetical protein
MRVFTKIDGKLAEFYVGTSDVELALETVRGSLTLGQLKNKVAILALVKG